MESPSQQALQCQVTTHLELIDKRGDYNIFVRIAVQVSNSRSSINTGRRLCRPFELYVLRARAFAWFLVTALMVGQLGLVACA